MVSLGGARDRRMFCMPFCAFGEVWRYGKINILKRHGRCARPDHGRRRGNPESSDAFLLHQRSGTSRQNDLGSSFADDERLHDCRRSWRVAIATPPTLFGFVDYRPDGDVSRVRLENANPPLRGKVPRPQLKIPDRWRARDSARSGSILRQPATVGGEHLHRCHD